MKDAIDYLKLVASDFRSMTTPNQNTITEQTAHENERLANQFDLAAEALRQMHNRLFEDGIVAGVKSLVDSCNARRLRKASPASVPVGYAIVPVEPTQDMQIPSYLPEVPWPMRKQIYKDMVAAAPTPPSTEDRNDAELWRDLVSHQKFNNVPAVGYAINQAKKRQARQEDKP